jgi:hypothetical protein
VNCTLVNGQTSCCRIDCVVDLGVELLRAELFLLQPAPRRPVITAPGSTLRGRPRGPPWCAGLPISATLGQGRIRAKQRGQEEKGPTEQLHLHLIIQLTLALVLLNLGLIMRVRRLNVSVTITSTWKLRRYTHRSSLPRSQPCASRPLLCQPSH